MTGKQHAHGTIITGIAVAQLPDYVSAESLEIQK